MDQAVHFLTTLTTIGAGSAFEIPEADVKLFLLTHHLRLLFKIIPSESAQLMKAHWWNIYPEMLFLYTFTFLFSECDSYAFVILTDGLRLLPNEHNGEYCVVCANGNHNHLTKKDLGLWSLLLVRPNT